MIDLMLPHTDRFLSRIAGFIWKNAAWVVILAAILVVAGINVFAEREFPEDLSRRLESLLGASMTAEAEPVYRELLNADPLDLELHFDHIQNHFNIPAVKAKGKAEPAWVAYYVDLSKGPTTRDIGLFGLGLIQAKQKDFDEALKYYRQVADRELKYLNLSTANAYLELENDRLAEDYFQREIEARGDIDGAVSSLLSLYLEQDQVDKLRALQNDPQLSSFIEPRYQRKLALMTGDVSIYLRFTFLQPVQRLSLAGILCALLVGAVWFAYLNRIDVFAGEPVLLSLGMVVAGSLSALVSLIFSDSMHELLPIALGQGVGTDLIFAILHIGLVEETAKFLPVLLVLPLVRRPREPFDLIFYGSLSALGFATLENALYFTRNGIGITASRFVISTVMHMCMTGIVSYTYARARYIRPGRLVPALLFGLGVSAIVHGLFDFFLLSIQARYAVLSILVLLLAAHEFYRFIRTTLNFSPYFDEAQAASPRLNNYALLYSSTAVVFTIVFLFLNFTFSTEIANKQLATLALISLPAILAIYTSLGRLQLTHGQAVPFMRFELVHNLRVKLGTVRRWNTRSGEAG